jgi:O-antigen ligase
MLAGWQMFIDNPLGVGTGGFGTRFSSAEYKLTSKDLQAHSAWIKTLAENGILGISVLAGFVGSFAKAGWRRRGEGHFPLGCLVTIAFVVAFLSTEFQGKGLWFLAAAVTSLFSYQSVTIRLAARDGRPQVSQDA